MDVLKELKASHDADQTINPVPVCQLLSTDDDAAMAQWNLHEAFGMMLISIFFNHAFKHVLMS